MNLIMGFYKTQASAQGF